MRVAPFMGAWIETSINIPAGVLINELLPLWEHGLKPLTPAPKIKTVKLLPLWEHGLKQKQSHAIDIED